RTSDLRFRKPLLYPAELRDQDFARTSKCHPCNLVRRHATAIPRHWRHLSRAHLGVTSTHSAASTPSNNKHLRFPSASLNYPLSSKGLLIRRRLRTVRSRNQNNAPFAAGPVQQRRPIFYGDRRGLRRWFLFSFRI